MDGCHRWRHLAALALLAHHLVGGDGAARALHLPAALQDAEITDFGDSQLAGAVGVEVAGRVSSTIA